MIAVYCEKFQAQELEIFSESISLTSAENHAMRASFFFLDPCESDYSEEYRLALEKICSS
jgi:hypothetical protein